MPPDRSKVDTTHVLDTLPKQEIPERVTLRRDQIEAIKQLKDKREALKRGLEDKS